MSSNNPLAAQPGQPGIDPRGPRFGATITVITLIIELVRLLSSNNGLSTSNSIGTNWVTPAGLLLSFIVLVFGIGAFAGIQNHPYGFLFKKLVRPRLQAPSELENPKPPTFAQLIGFIIAAAGLVFLVLGISVGAIIAVAFAFVAAFLNSVFNFCLGCQIYVLLVRGGIVKA